MLHYTLAWGLLTVWSAIINTYKTNFKRDFKKDFIVFKCYFSIGLKKRVDELEEDTYSLCYSW